MNMGSLTGNRKINYESIKGPLSLYSMSPFQSHFLNLLVLLVMIQKSGILC